MVCCGVANYTWAVVVLLLGLVHLHLSVEVLLDHVPDVVSLEEGEKFMYSYPCEGGVVDLLCYYIDGMAQPAIFSDVAFLPPFLQEGTTSAIQECPEFSTYNITFMVTTSMSGLLMFYVNGFGCDITNSVGPRPFLFNITTAVSVQPSPSSFPSASTPSQSTNTGISCTPDALHGDDDLSTGVIAGIIVGVVAVLAILFMAIVSIILWLKVFRPHWILRITSLRRRGRFGKARGLRLSLSPSLQSSTHNSQDEEPTKLVDRTHDPTQEKVVSTQENPVPTQVDAVQEGLSMSGRPAVPCGEYESVETSLIELPEGFPKESTITEVTVSHPPTYDTSVGAHSSTSEHPRSTPVVTIKDSEFPGIHFLGCPWVRKVTSEGAVISWEEFGIAFDIPPGAVPEDREPLELTVRPCLAGPFNPPDGYKFTSPTYIISPAFDFVKDIQLVLYHFAALQSDEDCEHMSFLSAPSKPQYAGSQPQYNFKRFRGGVFQRRRPFGTINLRHFCSLATGSSAPNTSLEYSARLYRNSRPPDPCSYAVFSISLKQALYFQHLQSKMEELGLVQMPTIYQPVRFADTSSTAHLELPRETPGWEILEDRSLEILKEEVDGVAQTPEENMVLGYPPKVCLSILPRAPTIPEQNVHWRLNVTGVDRNVFFTLRPSTSPVPSPVPQSPSSTVRSEEPSTDPSPEEVLGEYDFLEVSDYLHSLVNKPDIRSLGLVLGLGDTRLRTLEQTSDNLLDDVISAWIRREEDVDRRGVPSWATLVKALQHRRLGQTGIAENITRDKNLPSI